MPGPQRGARTGGNERRAASAASAVTAATVGAVRLLPRRARTSSGS